MCVCLCCANLHGSMPDTCSRDKASLIDGIPVNGGLSALEKIWSLYFQQKKTQCLIYLEATVWMFVFSSSCQCNIPLGWDIFFHSTTQIISQGLGSGLVMYIGSIFNC